MSSSIDFALPKASNNTGSSIPIGTFIVRLKEMVKEEQVAGPYGDADRVKWIFGVEQVVDSDDDTAEDRIGDDLWAFTSLSMGRKAKMRAHAEALLGRPLDEDEQVGVTDLVGKRAKASVVPHIKQDGTATTKLGSLMPYKAKKAAKPADEDELFD